MLEKALTAAEARKLAGTTVEEKVRAILVAIEAAAKEKKRQLRTGWEYKDDEELWIHGGYESSKDWNQAKKLLEELGYKVEFYYRESQFVDMYTIINW